MRFLRILCGLACMLAMSSGICSGWQQLGGNARRIAATELAISERPAVIWQRDIGGASFASAVVADNTAYTVAGRTTQASDVETGNVQWRIDSASDISATPVVVGRWLIIGRKDGLLQAIERSTGKVSWEFRTGGRVVASLLAVKDTVYAGTTNRVLYAIDVQSGKMRWNFEAPDYKYGGLFAPAAYADDTVYFGAKNAWLYAVESRTGVMRWRTHIGSAIYATPVIDRGTVYIGSYDRHMYALRQSDGAVLWRTLFPDWPQGGALPHAGKIYAACSNGEILVLRSKDGFIEGRIRVGNELRHGPVLGMNDRALIGTVGGELVILDLVRDEVAGRMFVSGAVHAQPALTQGGVFVTTLTGELLRLQ